MSRRYYASTACLPGTEPLPTRLARYREYGIDHIELGAGVIADDAFPASLDGVRGHTVIHNYFPPPPTPFVLNLASADRIIRTASIDLATRALEKSAMIGAPFYSVHGGFITDPDGFDGRSFRFPLPPSPECEKQALDLFVDSVSRLVEVAEKLSVRLLIENNVCTPELRGKLLFQRADEFVAFFDVMPHPALGMLLDTGHLNVSAATFAFNRIAFVDRLQHRVGAVHVHDNNAVEDSHDMVAAGSWVVDVLRRPALAHVPVILEGKCRDAGALHAHLAWLRAAVDDSIQP